MASDSKLPPAGRFKRLRKLAGLSAQLGGDVITRGIKRLSGAEPSLMSKGTAEKLVATLGDLKGAAMKLGQAVSMEADLLSPEVRAILARLQNEAPPMPFEQVAEVIEEELGAPPDQAFAAFDEAPMAAASLGQVHRAKLADGREVAVKVQYPGISAALTSDLDTLGTVVKAVAKTGKGLDGTAYYQELRHELLLETDYAREAKLARGFAEAVRKLPDLVVPDVIDERSTNRVLTLSYLRGPTLKEVMASDAGPEERARVSRLLIRALYGTFFLTGQVHADPHPGNFIVLPDGRLGLLDFGSVKQMSQTFVDVHRRVFTQVMDGEPIDSVAFCHELDFTFELAEEEARGLLDGIIDIGGRPLRVAEYDFGTSEIVKDMRKLLASHALQLVKIRPPPESVMFVRAMGGCTQDLKLLGARVPMATLFRELLAIS